MTDPIDPEVRAWCEELRHRASLADPDGARRALFAVFESFGEVLSADEAALLQRVLPATLASAVEKGARQSPAPGDYDDLIEAIETRENVGTAEAREHASATCEILGERVEADVGAMLRGRLPTFLVTMLDARAQSVRAPRHVPHSHDEPEERSTLATGRPGSAHPISEARPDRAHTNSVARSTEPHQETKLSSARGLTQERLGDTIAQGVAGPRRPVSGP